MLKLLSIIFLLLSLTVNAQDCPFAFKNGKLVLKQRDIDRVSALCDCNGLEELILRNLTLDGLPACIEELDLKELHLRKTSFPEMMSFVGNLRSLRSLRIQNVPLKTIPLEWTYLDHLERLDLRGTLVTSIPIGFTSLRVIDLRDVEISEHQREDIKKDYPDAQIYFTSSCNCN